jgi:hypothetical protein
MKTSIKKNQKQRQSGILNNLFAYSNAGVLTFPEVTKWERIFKWFILIILLATTSNLSAKSVKEKMDLFPNEVLVIPLMESDEKSNNWIWFQDLVVVNKSNKTVILESIEIEFYWKDSILCSSKLSAVEIFQEANDFFIKHKKGLLTDFRFSVSTEEKLKETSFSSSRVLESMEAIVVSQQYFAMDCQPDKIIIIAKGFDNEMEQITITYEQDLIELFISSSNDQDIKL